MAYIIETDNLAKEYKFRTALRSVTMTLEAGHIYALVGVNGAGKTSLFRILAGISRPTGGSFTLFGETTEQGQDRARQKTGFMIDGPVFYASMSARANLRNIQLIQGGTSKARLTEVLTMVGLNPRSRQTMSTYSLAMQQRYGLAAALIGDPELLILDEPLNGLDPLATQEMNGLLRSFRDQGKTILLSSQTLTEPYQLATDFLFIDQGKTIQQISHAELQERCDFRITVQTDEPEMAANVLRKKLTDVDGLELSNGCLVLRHSTQSPGSVLRALEAEKMHATVETSGIGLEDYFQQLLKSQQ